jgi:hypothetical protein
MLLNPAEQPAQACNQGGNSHVNPRGLDEGPSRNCYFSLGDAVLRRCCGRLCVPPALRAPKLQWMTLLQVLEFDATPVFQTRRRETTTHDGVAVGTAHAVQEGTSQ